jgi:ADP-heptose:LPS heptosyltransferase
MKYLWQKILHRLNMKDFLFSFRKKWRFPQKILLVRNGALGDNIVFLPVAQSLKKTFPYLDIYLLTTETGRVISRWNNAITGTITVDFNRLNSPYETKKLIQRLSQHQFDLIFLSTFDYNFREVAYILNSCVVSSEPYYSNYFDISLPYPAFYPERLRNLLLLKKIYPEIKVDYFPYLTYPEDYTYLLKKYGISSNGFLVIHIGGKRLSRIPPLKKWKEFIFSPRFPLDLHRKTVVLTGNSKEEIKINAEIEQFLQTKKIDKILNLTQKLTLNELLAIVGYSQLVISTDTGIAHVAAAFNKPQFIFWGPGDLKKWRPLNQNFQKIYHTSVVCSPCYKKDCQEKDCFSYL